MASDELLALAVNRVPFLKPREKALLLELCGTPERFGRIAWGELGGILGRAVRSRNWDPEDHLRQAEAELKTLTSGSIKCTFLWKKDFPPLLREIYDPPVVLYYRGLLPAGDEVLVGVVGTRHPTGAGRAAAFSLGFELAGLGIGTISGLARGIDAEAHRGSLAEGGRTVAVLGNGIDRVFPSSSAEVGRRLLARGGCILSEFPPGEPPRPYHFPGRNRIISGLARTVVVVQAPERSGALITAEYALEQGRDLAVHAEGLAGPAGAGTRALVEQGAELVRGAADILAGWGRPVPDGKDPRTRKAEAGGAGKSLARLLEKELAHEVAIHNGEVLYG